MGAVPQRAARRRLRARRDEAAGGHADRRPGGALGHRGLVRARDLARVGETMIVLIAMGTAAEPDFDPRETVRGDDGVHRRDRQRRRADGVDRVQDDLRGRARPLRLTLVMNMISIRLVRSTARSTSERRALEAGRFTGRAADLLARRRLCVARVAAGRVVIERLAEVDWQLLSDRPVDRPAEAGARPPSWRRSTWALLMLFSVPIGIGTAIYLEEYANRERWYNRLLELNIQNLAAVPVDRLRHPRPRVPRAGHRARPGAARRRADPDAARPADGHHRRARGDPRRSRLDPPGRVRARRDAVAGRLVARSSRPRSPGSPTGSILALSRAIGETAPLIMIGALDLRLVQPDDPGPVHGAADPDLPVDRVCRRTNSSPCGGGDHRPAGDPAQPERRSRSCSGTATRRDGEPWP